MTVYDDVYNSKQNSSTIKNRGTVAIAKAAIDILNEDVGTANHTERLAWAKIALTNPESMYDLMAWGVWGDSAIYTNGDAATDAQVQTAVNNAINMYIVLN